MAPFRLNFKSAYFFVAVLVLAFMLASPLADAHNSGGRGGHDGRGDRDDRGGGGENNSYTNVNKTGTQPTTSTTQQPAPAAAQPAPQSTDSGAAGVAPVKDNALLPKTTLSYDSASADQAQAEYFSDVAEYYKAAAAKSLALGLVTTAEGLGQTIGSGTQIGDGDNLIAAGLKSLEAGERMKQSEQAAMSKIRAEASAKELDEELMNDPLAEEVIERLVKKTGYSKAEVIEKILNSKGSLDALTEEFEAAAKRREQIDSAFQSSDADLAAIIEGSKSGALRRKIHFASLREALTTSATPAKKAAVANWKLQWARLATAQPAPTPATANEQRALGRAPASAPEFLNLGENLPSFELEEGQADEAYEISLFEKIHRKYIEITPSMKH